MTAVNKRAVAAAFGRAAGHYSQHDELQRLSASRLLEQLDIKTFPEVLDAGCGVGDGLKALRRAWPQAQVHGVEWSWPLRWLCALRCPWAKVRQGDLWQSDWSQFDVVYLFQRPESMTRAAVKSMGEMRDGCWLVSLNFPIPDVTPTYVAELEDGREVYAYATPLAEVDAENWTSC